MRQDNEQKKTTRRVLLTELSTVKEALKEALQKGESLGAGIIIIGPKLFIYKSFPLDVSNYKGIEFATLVKSLEISILNSVQKTYRMIDRYNEKMIKDAAQRSAHVGRNIDDFAVDEDETQEVIQQIEKTISEMGLRYGEKVNEKSP